MLIPPQDVSDTGDWSNLLADYIRRNDEALIKTTSALLALYQQKLLAATSIEDFVNILGILISRLMLKITCNWKLIIITIFYRADGSPRPQKCCNLHYRIVEPIGLNWTVTGLK